MCGQCHIRTNIIIFSLTCPNPLKPLSVSAISAVSAKQPFPPNSRTAGRATAGHSGGLGVSGYEIRPCHTLFPILAASKEFLRAAVWRRGRVEHGIVSRVQRGGMVKEGGRLRGLEGPSPSPDGCERFARGGALPQHHSFLPPCTNLVCTPETTPIVYIVFKPPHNMPKAGVFREVWSRKPFLKPFPSYKRGFVQNRAIRTSTMYASAAYAENAIRTRFPVRFSGKPSFSPLFQGGASGKTFSETDFLVHCSSVQTRNSKCDTSQGPTFLFPATQRSD